MGSINKNEFYKKVYGCWLGKSIGGTLGAPFEGRQELLNVTDFVSPSGQPLPNDDLDLQLVWLKAIEDCGPLGINEQVLGEYWISLIPPHWNEYGICKSNMKAGILPPLSGEYENSWKNSNGAWIRSEIWACMTPGCPDIAKKYAWYDACVDHGTGEGTYAEFFTASLQSAAFVISDRDQLIDIGLANIPKDCRVARSIKIVLNGYKSGLDWKETRKLVLDDCADLGWLQAPANIGFFIIGWLYGENDFKKSLLIAINCGDDTDCTAATLGATLGIINGSDGLPEDWKKHIGDDIVSISVDRGSCVLPKTCTELTEHVIKMAVQVLYANNAPISITDYATDLTDFNFEKLLLTNVEQLTLSNAQVFNFIHTEATLSYKTNVTVSAGDISEIEVTLKNKFLDYRYYEIFYLLPEGFEVIEGKKHIKLSSVLNKFNEIIDQVTFTVKIKVGTVHNAYNRGVIRIIAQGRPTVILLPLLWIGE